MLINAYMSFNIFNSKLMNHYTISMSSHKTVKILREQVIDVISSFASQVDYHIVGTYLLQILISHKTIRADQLRLYMTTILPFDLD